MPSDEISSEIATVTRTIIDRAGGWRWEVAWGTEFLHEADRLRSGATEQTLIDTPCLAIEQEFAHSTLPAVT